MRTYLVCVSLLVLALGTAGWGEERRDIVRWGNDIVVEAGTRVHNAVAIGGNVTVHGEVANDAVAVGGSVILGTGAAVRHNAVAIGGAVQKEKEAVIAGDMVEISAPGLSSALASLRNTNWWAFYWLFVLVAFLGLLALATLVVALFPRPVEAVAAVIEHGVLPSLLAGLAGALLVVPVAAMLAVSVVGLVLIPFEFAFVVLSLFFGYIAAAALVGRKILLALHKTDAPVLAQALAGIAVVFLAGLIPFAGGLIHTAVLWIGWGGVLRALIRARRGSPPREQERT